MGRRAAARVEHVNARLEADVLRMRRSLALGVCDSVEAFTPRASRRRREARKERALAVVGWVVFAAFLLCCLVAARR